MPRGTRSARRSAVVALRVSEDSRGSPRETLQPILRAVCGEGAITLAAIATALNDRKVPTPRSAKWHVSSVMNLLARTQKLEAVR